MNSTRTETQKSQGLPWGQQAQQRPATPNRQQPAGQQAQKAQQGQQGGQRQADLDVPDFLK